MARVPSRPHFEIWQVGSRIHSIDNPVRLKILLLLEERPRRLTELVIFTRKAKSTLSALHLPPLVEGGLVEEIGDPRDARVKAYKLLGHRLGSSAVDAPQLRDAVLSYAQSSGAIPLSSIVALVDPAGLVDHARPAYADAVATRIGHAVARMMTSRERAPALEELGAILERAHLGKIQNEADGSARLEATDPRTQGFVQRLAETAMSARLKGAFQFPSRSPKAPRAARAGESAIGLFPGTA